MVKQEKKKGWLFSGFRLRLLVWYCLLTSCTVLVSIQVTRQIYGNRLKTKSMASLVQQVKQFQKFKDEQDQKEKPSLKTVGGLFDGFFSNYVPVRNEYIITLNNNRIYKATPTIPENVFTDHPNLINEWKHLKEPRSAFLKNSTEQILYFAQPVALGRDRGVIVVLHDDSIDVRTGNNAINLVIQVTLIVLTGATILAWILAGQMLSPLHSLIETAQSITESDMTRRIPVRGRDEISKLSTTFNEMLDRLQFAFHSQQEFLKDVNHELKTPITIIQGHLEMLQYRPDRQSEIVTVVMDELERMIRLVNDLLLLAKAECPNFLKLKIEELDWLTEELYLKARVMANRNWRLESKGLSPINVDRQRLTQAIMNLVQNAIVHTDEDDTIAIGSSVKEDCVYIWVSDSGEGIALENQNYIFKRFARITKQNCTWEGHGLGLSIAQAIALSHGGWIELNSNLGQGSTFTLAFPLMINQKIIDHEPDSHC
jgi:signal transduction histidine kinase